MLGCHETGEFSLPLPVITLWIPTSWMHNNQPSARMRSEGYCSRPVCVCVCVCSVRAIPESGVADVRVKWSNHTNPCMTGLKYGCDLYSGKYGNYMQILSAITDHTHVCSACSYLLTQNLKTCNHHFRPLCKCLIPIHIQSSCTISLVTPARQ